MCKFVVLMQTSLHLNEKSREACIKAKSLAFIGQVTEYTTAKWPICEVKTVKAVEYIQEVKFADGFLMIIFHCNETLSAHWFS